MAERSRQMLSVLVLAPPSSPVPAPRGTTGTPCSPQIRTAAATSSVLRGRTTAAGSSQLREDRSWAFSVSDSGSVETAVSPRAAISAATAAPEELLVVVMVLIPGKNIPCIGAATRWAAAPTRSELDFMLMRAAGELLVYQQAESLGAAADLDLAIELLSGTRRDAADPAGAASTGPMIRIYRPQPTVAFGQRDSRLPGFEAAQQACRDLGFTPVIRRAGGRAAAYHRGSLVIDHIEPDADPIRQSQARFWSFGELFAAALGAVGIEARVGPIPAEYCFGEHSVHGISPTQRDVRIKLIGTAQRQIATGWLFSSSIIIEDGAPIRRVLLEAYAAMGLEWDPLTAGAAEDLNPAVTVETVEQAVLDAYAQHWSLSFGTPAALSVPSAGPAGSGVRAAAGRGQPRV